MKAASIDHGHLLNCWLSFPTATCCTTASFVKELGAGDLILVDSLLTRIGHKSCSFTERMLRVDTREVHATYETTEVFFDPQTRRSVEMTAPIRQALENA
jgi:acyl-CoA thioester hydrolase